MLFVDPNNKAAKKQITLVNSKVKQAKEKEKKLYGGMFSKFAAEDAKVGEQLMRARPPKSNGGDRKYYLDPTPSHIIEFEKFSN